MEKINSVIAAMFALGLLLGWVLEPAITLLAGLSVWIILALIYTGAEDPNPHRTSIALHRGIPDSPLVKLALKDQPGKSKLPIPAKLILLMFLAGGLLVVTGFMWMM